MTSVVIWSSIEINPVKQVSSFDISQEGGMPETFSWIITQPLLNDVQLHKGTKFDFIDFTSQFVKTYQFLKPNEMGIKLKKNLMEFTVNHLERQSH